MASVAADTSVLVPLYLSEHELHAAASEALGVDVLVPAHALLETYAALTALPAPYRQDPAVVQEWFAAEFPTILPYPQPPAVAELLQALAAAGLRSGAVYDGIVALSAIAAQVPLVTADQRAIPVYHMLAAELRVLRPDVPL